VAALQIAATFQIFDGWNITLMGALRGGGDTLWPAVAQQLLAWLGFAPLAWAVTGPWGGGLAGAWWASAAYLAALCGLLYWRYRRTRWLEHDIFGNATGAAG
jgi:multidrug resistance protein, MATE family